MKVKWVAYGLDMAFDYIIFETEGTDNQDCLEKAVAKLRQQEIDFDTVEPFDISFLQRVGLLEKEENER